MESGRLRSVDIQKPYPRLDPDPRRNLLMSSRVPIRRVVMQSGPGRVGTQSRDNYSDRRYPDVPPSGRYLKKYYPSVWQDAGFPVTQNNFRFEPPNFPVAEWMLIFFRFKEEFSDFGITFFRFRGWGRGVVSWQPGRWMISVLNNLFSTLGAE